MNPKPHNSIEEILERGKSVRLSEFDKNEIRKALINVMAEPQSSRTYKRVRMISWSFSYLRVPLTAALILVLTGGTSFAAQSSIPGDVLYPVKVGVNEKVETLLAVGAKEVATVTAKHALTRLSEAEALAAHGKLDAETKVKIEEHFYENVADLRSNLKKLEGSGDFNAAAIINGSFEEGLGEHLGAFVSLSVENGTGTPQVVAIAASVGNELQSTQVERVALRERQVANASPSTLEAAKGAQSAAEKKIMEVENYVATHASTTASVQNVLTARLTSVHELMLAGVEKVNAEDYAGAFALFKKAETLAQDAKLLSILGNKVKKNLTVRNSASRAALLRESIKGKGAEGVEVLRVMPAVVPPDVEDLNISISAKSEFKEQVDASGEVKGGIDIEVQHEENSEGEGSGIRVNISI
jgi:hypothetical protein